MFFSIVTVTYNASKALQLTIESVLKQELSFEIEYLFIDGCSTDDTLSIIDQNIKSNNNTNIKFRVISEKDNGLYDAMNKAYLNASGEYILFMNAGDQFYDENVLIDTHEEIVTMNYPDVFYGGVCILKNNENRIIEARDIKRIPAEMPFCHQSVFVKSSIYKDYSFNTKYRICADYDYFYRLYLDGASFYKSKITVSVYDTNGLTAINRDVWYHEKMLICNQYRKQDNTNIYIKLLSKYYKIRSNIKRFLIGHF